MEAGLLKTRPLHALLSDPTTSCAARRLFDALPRPTPALCSTLLSALSRLSAHHELLEAFSSLHRKGAEVPPGCLPLVIKSCALSAASCQGRQVHCHALVRGLLGDIFVQTALVDLYAKNGDMESAVFVFEEMPVKDPIPINCLITGYSKSGDVDEARRLFDGMSRRTSASWNSMIACYAHGGEFQEALTLFDRMLSEGARPNAITITTMFSICAKSGDLNTGKRVRALIGEEDLQNVIVHTALMEMYVKCRAIDEARQEFDRMSRRDVVAWSTMIAGYAQNGRPLESLQLFERMKATDCRPNEVTLVGVLSACAQLGSDELVEQIGNYAESQRLPLTSYLGSALIDMYTKCGHVGRARSVFDRMKQKVVITWNSMIRGLALNGFAEEAISLYEKMAEEGVQPNEITFVALLAACTHAGLVDQGMAFYEEMERKHHVSPQVEHCACIVDLLCKSGRLWEAYKFICDMQVEPNAVIWTTLLSACRVHADVRLAKLAASKLLVMEPDNSSIYVLLSNIYADAGLWVDVREVRDLMRSNNVQKLSAYSWIELDGEVHKFLVQDTYHPKSAEIYDVVDGLGLMLDSDPDLLVSEFC
ncbi:pentatricopeptide repeat-containing protein At1g08070, chloroplastic [Brachypodium distachyon]|uniref:pentatricopeptide repeat-containing protein At1g08070, chloroplastic n=1 Tax=Brachypodium distachyon TaxID=15368 RepID=UPI0001C72A85|nr:pentatricopeptide repeat-containing protein At1g08070, chloroplastic [Brachypodium distachyon]|eukprot:XP_010232231.1 pentatricopeptide repeat-containing protein At1g08070, chloroplastic [Brachypodium distachyon]